ncbi:ATP-dependent DNA ligase [Thermocrinis minervae]|uniref:Probable DNA ligase n=1 Tax=Thermocrinis minervae TaxID=381751 RepID=A0A1M6QSS2_9AQUI|nr:ATP-dependent DNA ligase [Thermocrinis minervae]SHK23160.1 DNA ligase-1 [Thermocrinis minervae]
MKFSQLADYFERLERITSRIELSEVLAEVLKNCLPEEVDKVIYLLMGEIAPPYRGLEFGLSEKLTAEATSKAYGVKISQVNDLYKKLGDLGEVALHLNQREGKGLDVVQVYQELYQVASAKGTWEKVMRLVNLLRGLSGKESKYVVRIVIGRLRLGIGEATLIEALALAFGRRSLKELIERAYNLCSDLGLVASTLFKEGVQSLESFKIQVGYPIRPALAERVSSPSEIISRLGRCALEVKYDGFRLQIHKKGKEVEIYSRNLERMTQMFPDVVSAVLELPFEELIFEGEAIAYNESTGEFYPFQITIQRKRKYDVHKYSEEYPLKLFAFDLLYLEGEDYTVKPFVERRKRLEGVVIGNSLIEPSEMIIAEEVKQVEEFFEKAIERGLEGIMAKRLDAPYTAGSRNFNWIKLKRSYKGQLSDSLDLVIVGYFYGRGNRAKLGIGAVLAAVYDRDSDTFKTVAKVGSGFTEEEWIKLKHMLDEIKLERKHPRVESTIEPDVWTEPRYVITVLADEITISPIHTAGYALRFPRAVGFIRADKNPEDATDLSEILRLYEIQRKVTVGE